MITKTLAYISAVFFIISMGLIAFKTGEWIALGLLGLTFYLECRAFYVIGRTDELRDQNPELFR
jgi:hypothetical protein